MFRVQGLGFWVLGLKGIEKGGVSGVLIVFVLCLFFCSLSFALGCLWSPIQLLFILGLEGLGFSFRTLHAGFWILLYW